MSEYVILQSLFLFAFEQLILPRQSLWHVSWWWVRIWKKNTRQLEIIWQWIASEGSWNLIILKCCCSLPLPYLLKKENMRQGWPHHVLVVFQDGWRCFHCKPPSIEGKTEWGRLFPDTGKQEVAKGTQHCQLRHEYCIFLLSVSHLGHGFSGCGKVG